MLWSIDSCQNKESAEKYHMTISRAQGRAHQGHVFLIDRWPSIGQPTGSRLQVSSQIIENQQKCGVPLLGLA